MGRLSSSLTDIPPIPGIDANTEEAVRNASDTEPFSALAF